MKKLVIRIATIAAAFLLGVAGMSYFLMAGNTDSTAEMAGATLPLIYMEQNGRDLNLLHGYTKSMDAASIRDAVYLLPQDRTVSFRVEYPDAKVQKVYYELRSVDTTRLIEDGELTDYSREGRMLTVDLKLKDLLDDGEEYLLVIRLGLEKDQEAYYYTHVKKLNDNHLDECLAFVDEIHSALFDKNNTVSIAQYLESDDSISNKSLAHVSIHSKYKQLIWGDMDVQEPDTADVRTYVTEIDNSVASVRLEYPVTYINDAEETETYEVTESYRVRYTSQRMYLLNYDRKADRVFDPTLDIFTKKGVELGILDTAVEYRKNDEENIVGFVQNGELWCYDVAQNKLSLVFGFREGSDLRGSYDEHAIRILKVDESGSMDFLVYGYMNRGTHEGETGVALYTYDALTNSVEERVFIESQESFAVLQSKLGEMAYVNNDGQFYIFLDGTVLRVELSTMEYEAVADGIVSGSGMVSEDGHLAAWHKENSLYASRNVAVLNLDTGKSREVQADEGYYIRALGFMGTDFIYGEARQSDVQKGLTGNELFPMGRIVIENEQGELVREFDYESQGKYVTDISIESNRISLNCVQRSADGSYVEADPEPITNKTTEIVEKISLETKSSEPKKQEYYFALSGTRGSGKLRTLMPKQVVYEGSRTLTLGNETTDQRYYVYNFDGIFGGAFTGADEAVQTANENMGIVVDRQQNILWTRGGRKTRTDLGTMSNPQQKDGESALQAALEILLGTQKTYGDVGAYLAQGYTPYEILVEQTGDRVLDLSGCSVSMVLYYVSQGYPVLALEGGSSAELITGYDPQNIIVTDPLTGESSKRGMNDSTEQFAQLGNLFLVCLPETENEK